MKDFNNGDWKTRHDRSKKTCCCGGHNASNCSRNMHHHSTLQRFKHRLGRLFKRQLREEIIEGDADYSASPSSLMPI